MRGKRKVGFYCLIHSEGSQLEACDRALRYAFVHPTLSPISLFQLHCFLSILKTFKTVLSLQRAPWLINRPNCSQTQTQLPSGLALSLDSFQYMCSCLFEVHRKLGFQRKYFHTWRGHRIWTHTANVRSVVLSKKRESSLGIRLCRFPNTLESERAAIVSPMSAVLTKRETLQT